MKTFDQTSPAPESFKYEIAISFAEEDRNAALALALALEITGYRNIYYYPENRVATIGRPLDRTLETIYSEEARYAIILLSAKYAAKPYTRIELAAILKRVESAGDQVYLIPVLLEEAGLEALPELKNLGYLPWSHDPRSVAGTMWDLFGKQTTGNAPDKQKQVIIQAIQRVTNQQSSHGQVNINTNTSNGHHGK